MFSKFLIFILKQVGMSQFTSDEMEGLTKVITSLFNINTRAAQVVFQNSKADKSNNIFDFDYEIIVNGVDKFGIHLQYIKASDNLKLLCSAKPMRYDRFLENYGLLTRFYIDFETKKQYTLKAEIHHLLNM